MKHLLLYGLQRSGTSYVQTLLPANFDIKLEIDTYTYSLPIHKHFRPYAKPWFFPHLNLLHNFSYASFSEFDAHCQRLTHIEDLKYIVVAKEPYSWYLSFYRFANRESIFYRMKKKYIHHMYVLDYSQYFKKWLEFRDACPEKVMIVNYESFLEDFEGAMDEMKDKLGLTKTQDTYQNFSKVGMSKKFTKEKKDMYLKGESYKTFRDEELLVLSENLDEEVVNRLGYQVYYPRGIQGK
ncbi:MAG: sulfotransferase domain-containing protein [Bacteroidota bacterium]